MIISSPGQYQIISNSTMTIDSILSADSTSIAFVTINPPGWHAGGLESIAETILENTIGN